MLGTEVFPIQGPISGCGGLSATEAFLADRTTYYTWYHGMTGYWHHHIDITSTSHLPIHPSVCYVTLCMVVLRVGVGLQG